MTHILIAMQFLKIKQLCLDKQLQEGETAGLHVGQKLYLTSQSQPSHINLSFLADTPLLLYLTVQPKEASLLSL